MSVYVCVYRVIICTKIITFKYLFFFCYCLSDTFNLRNEFSLIAPVIDFYLNGTDCVSPLGIFILYTGNKLAFKCSVLFKFRSLSYSLCTSSYLAFDFFFVNKLYHWFRTPDSVFICIVCPGCAWYFIEKELFSGYSEMTCFWYNYDKGTASGESLPIMKNALYRNIQSCDWGDHINFMKFVAYIIQIFLD